MGVTGFTFILVPLCLLWIMAPARLLQLMVIAGVFEAAAALTIGGVGLQPGLVPGIAFLGFIGLQLLLGATYPGQAQVLAITRPFVLVAAWAVVSSFLMPRVFQGTVFVWPEKPEPPFVLTALAPTSSNINQDCYLILNTALLVTVAMFLTRRGLSLTSFLRAYFNSAYLAAGIAVWQFASKLAGVPYPEDLFYSNPGWSILTQQQIGAMPRINGSFPEPSSLGSYMGAIVCATGWQLLQGHRNPMLPRLFVIGLLTMMLSTSTTGFAVLALAITGVLALALLTGQTRMMASILRLGIPLMLLIGVIYVTAATFVPQVNNSVADIFSATLTKQDSDSYNGRTSTDLDSLMVAVDTFGLGAGWGSNRSSSLIPGVLSALGVPGLVGFFWFGVIVTRRVRRARRSGCAREHLFVIDGCCGALTGFLLAALVSGPTITSVIFFFLTALLIACVVRVESDARAVAAGAFHGMGVL